MASWRSRIWGRGGAQISLLIPLVCIHPRRAEPGVDPLAVERTLRRSVEHALAHPEEPAAYVKAHAQEMDEAVMRRHIGLCVNALSVDLGEVERHAGEALLAQARQREPGTLPPFPDGKR